MKALVLVEPYKLVLEERLEPEPGPTDVVIEVAAASICHTDFFTLEGHYPDTRYPTVMGHEFSGVVTALGEGVPYVAPGDRVSCMGFAYCGTCRSCRRGLSNGCINIRGIPFHMDGAYQEYVSVPSEMVFKIDDRLSFDEGALAEPAANGYAAVETAGINPGEHVVVIGPGPIGLLALQCAALKSPGSLTMLGTRPERLALAEELGATRVVNVREEDPYKVIMEITNSLGADAVILCAGTEDAWELSGRVLAKYGRVVVEALPPVADTHWPVRVFDFTAGPISYLGVSGYTAGQYQATLELLKLGYMDVKSLITHRFCLEEYEEAFETCEKRLDGAIKVIFEIKTKAGEAAT